VPFFTAVSHPLAVLRTVFDFDSEQLVEDCGERFKERPMDRSFNPGHLFGPFKFFSPQISQILQIILSCFFSSVQSVDDFISGAIASKKERPMDRSFNLRITIHGLVAASTHGFLSTEFTDYSKFFFI